jgi:Ca2+-binding RTX toxin-like protein
MMSGRRGSFRRIASAVTATLVAVPLSLIAAAPARAEEAWETAFKTIVADAGNWAKGGAEQVGQLAQPLPLLGVSPGALVDADHLIERASTKLASGLTVDEDLDANTHLTSTVTENNGDRLLDVTLTARRTESDQGLTVAGITVAKAAAVTGWATLRLKVMHTAAGETFFVDDAVAPRIDIDVVSHFRPDLDKASASIGILGVAVTPGPADDPTALTATAHLRVDVTDPNHDGKLAFDTSAGPDTGELAAPGSLAGLLQIGFDPSGGKTGDGSAPLNDNATEGGAGHAQARVHFGATAASNSLNLPSSIAAAVTLDWPNISVGTPTVTTTGLDETIAKFRNMSPLDLASGLAQLATLLGGIQQSGPAGNLNLPFLRGSFADAVKINEKLVAFLDQNVNKLDVGDPAQAGQPKFSSIQELLKLLGDAGLPVSGLNFADDKLAFTVELTRTSATEVALDPGAASVSGQDATYSATGFTLPSNRFQAGALVGQRVVAGTSGGTVFANTANSITLKDGWAGGTPAAGSPWVITSSDPHTGAVELGGALTDAVGGKKVGLRTANAQASFAKVKPSYTAKVTLVLDLRTSVSDPADRVLLRTDPTTPLFTADFPITTAIEFFTKAGFLKVKLGGQLAVGPAAAGDKMLSVKFKQAQDISLGQLFAQLQSNPTGLLEVASSVKTTGQVTVSVPDAGGSLATGATLAVSWKAGDAAPTVDTTPLADLFSIDFNPDDPQAMFALVISALQAVSQALTAPGSGNGPLDQKLPLVGRSARQMLGMDESGVGQDVSYEDGTDGTTGNFRLIDGARSDDSVFTERLIGRTVVIGSQAFRVKDFVNATTLEIAGDENTTKPANGSAYALRPELADAVDGLLATPPDTLQDAIGQLNKVLGNGSGLSFTLDKRAGGPYLRLGLDWQRAFHTAGPVNLGWDGVGGLVSLDSSGTLDVGVSGQANLGLLLPLSASGTPLLDKSSSASVTVAAGASDIALGARVGPITLELGRANDPGTVKANVKAALGGLAADGPVTDLLGLTPTLTTDGVDCGGNDSDTAFCASIPVFSSLCTIPGDNHLAVSATTALNVTGSFPDLSGCFTSLSLTDLNLGLDGYLSKMEDALRLASFDGKLPLVGEDLQQGQRFIGDLRQQIKDALGPALANAAGNSQDLANALELALDSIDPNIDATVTCQDGFAVPCQLSEVQSVRIQFRAVKGNPNATTGCDTDCLEADVPLDLGMPGLSLKAAQGDTGGITAKLGWQVQLDLVLDRTAGFYVGTGGATPELQIGANFDVQDDLQAQLAFIAVTAEKQGTAPLAHAYFGIDLKGGADPNRLTLAELGDIGSRLDPALTLAVNIDWKLHAKIDTGDEVGSAFPGISAEFTLAWSLDNHKGGLSAGDLDIDFKNVTIDAGAFFSRILKPVLEKLKTVTGPLQPIVDTLYAPIPVLSDLAEAVGQPPVTLVSLAKAFNTLGVLPSLDFIDTIRAIVDFVNKVPTCSDECGIDIGGFSVPPDKALNTPVSPATAASLISGDPSVDGAGLKTAIDGKATGQKVFASTGGDKSNADKVGFTFPVFDNPKSLFGLLMGQDVELIGFDSGPLTLGFSWRQSFGPVYAPPPVFITLSGSASVSARIVAGLDTAGIRHAYEAIANGAPLNGVSLLDGLYFKTADAAGNPVPVVTLRGEIAAGAEVSVLFLKAGVSGGVALTVGFHWNDPNNDGKFRTSEFLQLLLVNPICLFTTSGQLSVFLKVYITIDLFLFSKTFDFTLVNAVLLDFRAQPDCAPKPPELAGEAGDTLVVFAGQFGKSAQRGNDVWDNTKATYSGDVFKIYALYFQDGNPSTFDGFAVEALGRRQEFLNPGLKRVVVDGRNYNPGGDKTGISVVFLGDGDTSKTGPTPGGEQTKQFDKTAIVFGSEAPDKIKTGTGPSYVDGRGGDDVITTGDAPNTEVWVAGGGGKDDITTGRGKAVVSGDSSLGDASATVTVDRQVGADLQLDVVNWNALSKPAESPFDGPDDAADHITVGNGSNTVYGNDGDDVIGVLVKDGTANGENLLAGGDGGDIINGGSAKDKIYTFSTGAPSDPDSSGLGDFGSTNSVDTVGGPDEVYGSAGIDLVTSHSANGQTGLIYGYGANDVLVGGYGTDKIYGGPGDDYVIAEPSEVHAESGTDPYGPVRPVTHTPLPTGVSSQEKLLVGGLDSDHIIGGDGGATIFGDKYLPDEVCADNDTFSQVDPENQGSADLILGGAGVDVVSAGGGGDRTDLGLNNDRACGQDGPDILHLGDGADKAWGGDDGDQIYGDAGTDLIFGNEGNDGLYGGIGTDTIEGNNGGDHAFGGPDNDIVYGGTRAAGATDIGTDYLYGEEGQDRLLGDNGTAGAGAIPYDLDGTIATAGAHDVISGGPDDDVAFGGLGNDDIFGDDADDHLEGNNGSDTIHGNAGEDQVVGGSFQAASPGVGRPDTGDVLYGDDGSDLMFGDNADASFVAPADSARLVQQRGFQRGHAYTLLDLGLTPTAGTSGDDQMSGGAGADVLLGQGGKDRIKGDANDDYAEGGQDSDWVEGDGGDDDLVGGSSTVLSGSGETAAGQPDGADALFGGPDDDVAVGDNAVVLRPLANENPTRATVRLGAGGDAVMTGRIVGLLDRRNGSGDAGWRVAPPADRFGADWISGGDGVDALWGQDGGDYLSGGGDADYVEGNGGSDTIRGDRSLSEPSAESSVPPVVDPGWPGSPSPANLLNGPGTAAGQDDLIGGSAAPGFRDGPDTVEGNAEDDVMLGDNGSLMRTVVDEGNESFERVYAERYPTGAIPANATVARTHDPDLPGPSTRFCTTAQATCEPDDAFGGDLLYGDGGNDGMWGQDGNDTLYGGADDDDMYGELGDDAMYGNDGEDAMVGDRGGIVNQFMNADDVAALSFTDSNSGVPKETYVGFRAGLYDRRVDLEHDVDGDAWIGSPTDPAMPHDGIAEGGRDTMRGGAGNDNIHAGYGDDLANGDSGGDQVFGDDGADALWGGKGCDPVLDASTADCLVNGVFSGDARGTNDRFVDHIFGGAGATSGPSLDGALGADVIDFNPRGTYPNDCAAGLWPTALGKATVDPCTWFVMTDKDDDATPGGLANNQHHHGTDWIYGGWDRDVMQGDVTENGPNPGDRLFDWNGAYNLYTHCNAAYGGYNDVRQHSPDMNAFLTQLAWGTGAGRTPADVTTQGTSAYRELAFVYTSDNKDHGSGKAFPGTPGHFDDPVSCAD